MHTKNQQQFLNQATLLDLIEIGNYNSVQQHPFWNLSVRTKAIYPGSKTSALSFSYYSDDTQTIRVMWWVGDQTYTQVIKLRHFLKLTIDSIAEMVEHVVTGNENFLKLQAEILELKPKIKRNLADILKKR